MELDQGSESEVGQWGEMEAEGSIGCGMIEAGQSQAGHWVTAFFRHILHFPMHEKWHKCKVHLCLHVVFSFLF